MNKNHDKIWSQFCTCHDSWAVMACAKLWPDCIIRIKITTKVFYSRFQLRTLVLLEKCVPVTIWHRLHKFVWNAECRIPVPTTTLQKTQYVTLLLLRPEYSRRTRSISWLLMPWILPSGHQQPLNWPCWIKTFKLVFHDRFQPTVLSQC